ncbi:MAG: monovalent cation/H(+) antiporter subunit G [Hyphomonadaceae bacterium]|nr:monovalent cation/H(+) antiporter subunit G [Hyphomonadaceae bacterium]
MLGAFGSLVGGVSIAFGLMLMAVGQLGVFRLPDVYMRAHAANVADGAGAALFAVGLALMAPDGQSALRLALLAALVWGIAPLLSHLSATAAHHGGVAPRVGAGALGGDVK